MASQNASVASQEAVCGQRRLEFGPTAAKVENKRSGKRAAILARLESGPARTWDLMLLGGAGFSSRIRELRVEGHRIECEQDEDGATYRLVEG